MEKQLNRKEIYDGKVIHVVKDDILTSDNKQAIREVVLHNGGACIALKDESDGKYALKTDTYTKAESDTNYASKTDTYTKSETYSKSEIDTKIGDINNILESI